MRPEMIAAMGTFSILRLTSMMGLVGIHPTKEQLLELNAALNQVPKK